jgi:hypothetical protein
MKKSDVVYIVGATFIALTNLFYCCTMWFGIKLPRYYPRLHTWKWFNKIEGEPSQGWYGMQAFVFLAAGITTLVVYFILKRVTSVETNLKPALTRKLAYIVTLIVIVCMGHMLYHEFAKSGIFTSMGLQ